MTKRKPPAFALPDWIRPAGFRSRALLAVLAVLFITVAVALAQSIGAAREARAQVALTEQVLRSLRGALRAVTDAETAQRGFLLTGDEAYLEPFDGANGARERWPYYIDELERTLEGIATADQERAIFNLRELAAAKMGELEQTIALYRDGEADKALALVRSDLGRQLMLEFRREIDLLETEEEKILARAIGRAESVDAASVPLLVILGFIIMLATVYGFWLERQKAFAEAAANEAEELREARRRSDLLAAELSHRVKNLFTVVLAIVGLAARGSKDKAETIDAIRKRIHALALAHSATDGQQEVEVADLQRLLSSVLRPYENDEDSRRIELSGPAIALPSRAVTPLGLIVHELATNASKYGALSTPDGRVSIDWRVEAGDADQPFAHIEWTETGGPELAPEQPAAAGDGGSGTIMLVSAAQQLGGDLRTEWRREGIKVVLTVSLKA